MTTFAPGTRVKLPPPCPPTNGSWYPGWLEDHTTYATVETVDHDVLGLRLTDGPAIEEWDGSRFEIGELMELAVDEETYIEVIA